MNKFLKPRVTYKNEDALKLGMFIMLGFVIGDIWFGEVPDTTVMMVALLFYAWRRDIAFAHDEKVGQAIGREANELALRIIIVTLVIASFVSFFVDTMSYPLESFLYFTLAFVFVLKGIGLWFFMPEKTVEAEPNEQ
ncbi:hypothetical protein A6395_10710 [Exiguobacterium sp. SH31]|uniref:hypothetical protein n=1 Tax=Exiguobacterium sp. SH31 TaxID=1843183 RepID=UPI0008B93FD2|nr:hypothetical protein [Exiguobacterium sp. SH31]OGX78685.1 hypothetical protein A6395_10710 [Exiguobacterium sp. SH31]